MCNGNGNNGNNGNEQCFISTDFFSTSFTLPCGVQDRTFYEDLTNNHNKSLVNVSNFGTDCGVIVTIVTDDETIVRDIPPRTETFFASQRGFQVEDLREVSIRCEGEGGTCRGFVSVRKTFCICCGDQDEENEKDEFEKLSHEMMRKQMGLNE